MQTATGTSLKGMQSRFATWQKNVTSSLGALQSGNVGGIGSIVGGLVGGATGAGLSQVLGVARQLGGALSDFIKAGTEAIKNQEKLTQQLGISRDAAVALSAVGQSTGMDFAELQKNAFDVQREFGRLRSELAASPINDPRAGGETAAALRRLGIDVERFANLRFDQQLGAIGDRLRTLPNAADRAATAFAILGRESRDFLPMLEMGSDGFTRLQRTAVEFGAVASDNVANSVRGTISQLRELQLHQSLAAQGMQVQFVSAMHEAAAGVGTLRQELETLHRVQPQALEASRQLGSLVGGAQRATLWMLQNNIAPIAGAINSVFGNRPSPISTDSLNSDRQAIETARADFGDLDNQLVGIRAIEHEWTRAGAAAARAMAVRHDMGEADLQLLDRYLARLDEVRAELPGSSPSTLAAERIRLLNRDTDSFITSLRRQAETWGMNAEQITRYDLVARGLSGDRLRAVEKELHALDRLREAQNQWAEEARLHHENTRATGIGNLREQIDEIMNSGLSNTARNARLGQLAAGLGNQQQTSLPQLLEFNSVEAASAMNYANRPILDAVQSFMAAVQEMARRDTELNTTGQRIADALRSNGFDDFLNGR